MNEKKNNYIDVVAHYNVKVEYDSEGNLFDINVNDGVHSISVDTFEQIGLAIKELEERCC